MNRHVDWHVAPLPAGVPRLRQQLRGTQSYRRDRSWGALEPNESPQHAVVREVREETGLDVVPRELLGVFAGPEFEVEYTNGDRVTQVMALYRCEVTGGVLGSDGEETRAARFVDPHSCGGLRVAPWVRVVLDHLAHA